MSAPDASNPARAPVDLMTAELEMTSSIYEGFSTAIVVRGQPRTVGLFREFADAVQWMATIWQNRRAHEHLTALTRSIPAVRRAGSPSQFLGASCAMMAAYDAALAYLDSRSDSAAEAGGPSIHIGHLTPEQQADIRSHVVGLSDPEEEFYTAPPHGWTCFHCGETFKTDRGAALHFGEDVKGRPTCQSVLGQAEASRLDRDALITIIMEETTDDIVADGWNRLGKPNVLVQGCRFIRRSAPPSPEGYENPEEAAKRFAGFIADRILQAAPSPVRPSCTVADDVEMDCPVCAEPLRPSELCLSDIDLGICHAACLEGSPVVNLDTGEPLPADAPAPTPYRYGDI